MLPPPLTTRNTTTDVNRICEAVSWPCLAVVVVVGPFSFTHEKHRMDNHFTCNLGQRSMCVHTQMPQSDHSGRLGESYLAKERDKERERESKQTVLRMIIL